MKNVTWSLILFITLLNSSISAQIVVVSNDSLLSDRGAKARLQHVANNEFSQITSANANGNLGNYVGLSTANNNIAFSYSLLRNLNIIEFSVAAASNSGISNLISNSEFTNNIQLGITKHWMLKNPGIEINYNQVDVSIRKYKELEATYQQELADLANKIEKTEGEIKKKKAALNKAKILEANLLIIDQNNVVDAEKDKQLKKQLAYLKAQHQLKEKQIKNVESIISEKKQELKVVWSNPRNTDVVKDETYAVDTLKAEFMVDSLKSELTKLENAMKQVEKNIELNKKTDVVIEKAAADRQLIEAELKQLKLKQEYQISFFYKLNKHNELQIKKKAVIDDIKSLRAESIKLKWFSIGVMMNNTDFNLLLNSGVAPPMIKSQNDLIPSLKFSFSCFSNQHVASTKLANMRKIHFFSVGGSVQEGNNLASLKKMTVRTIDSISNHQFSFEDKTVYQGTFKENVISANFFIDFYEFINAAGNIGYHVRTTLDVGPYQPVYSGRFGLIFSALKKEQNKSVINFELFYGLNDIFKEADDESLLARNVLGIQTTFPLKFSQ